LISEQLIREKWVMHGPTGRLPRGRRPTFLRLNELRGIVVADLPPVEITVAMADVERAISIASTPNNPQLAMTTENSSLDNTLPLYLSRPTTVTFSTPKLVINKYPPRSWISSASSA
jgi:hypothetical protein